MAQNPIPITGGNPNVEIEGITTLSDDWYVLRKIHFSYRGGDGRWTSQAREAYDRGNGAALLLYDPGRDTIILTRQFRMPTYVNGNEDGMLVEACAGLLDGEDPEAAIIREAEEETGYRPRRLQKLFEAYMSPGSVTELLHFYLAEYDPSSRVRKGGGVEGEEEIEVVELTLDEAEALIESGGIRDGKTIMLIYHLLLSRGTSALHSE